MEKQFNQPQYYLSTLSMQNDTGAVSHEKGDIKEYRANSAGRKYYRDIRSSSLNYYVRFLKEFVVNCDMSVLKSITCYNLFSYTFSYLTFILVLVLHFKFNIPFL